MFVDIVIPNKNEEEFCITLNKLGFKAVIFLYDKNSKGISHIEEEKLTKKHKISVLKTKSICITRDNIRDKINNKSTKAIIGFVPPEMKEFIHQRNAGTNQVICKEAAAKQKYLGLDVFSLLNSNTTRRSRIIGRYIQNISLFKKYKVKPIIASLAKKPNQVRHPNDIISLFYLFGMEKAEIKKSMQRKIK